MGKKLLIIDDNEQDRKIMARCIKDVGFEEILHAESGEEGINLARENKPDVIVLDTNLPQMDGFEVCRTIKEMDGLDTKVVMLTGFVDAVDAGKARQVGADDYCVKTSDCESLLNVLKSFN